MCRNPINPGTTEDSKGIGAHTVYPVVGAAYKESGADGMEQGCRCGVFLPFETELFLSGYTKTSA